jgi:hypothetical protein
MKPSCNLKPLPLKKRRKRKIKMLHSLRKVLEGKKNRRIFYYIFVHKKIRKLL